MSDEEGDGLYMGEWAPVAKPQDKRPHRIPPHHLLTHAAILGMTGSGKTGLITVLIEEALRNQVPVIAVDVKGDLPNLFLAVPSFAPEELLPYVAGMARAGDRRPEIEIATEIAAEREKSLATWGLGLPEVRALRESSALRLITPGSDAGEPLHLFSAIETRSSMWDIDREAARASLSASMSLVLRMLGVDADPARSREHVLLCELAERRLITGQDSDIRALTSDLMTPPMEEIGIMKVDDYVTPRERVGLVQSLNTLVASRTFASWRQGSALDIDAWLTPKQGRTPGVIFSVAHLGPEEQMLSLSMLLEALLASVKQRPGSSNLKALVLFDEIAGFLPPHPRKPSTKAPLVALMKQARAFGVGMVVATQNTMDLDYRALSNAGLWWLGHLVADGDGKRVMDGLALGGSSFEDKIKALLPRLKKRWFLERDVHADRSEPILMRPRHAMSVLGGPLTEAGMKLARQRYLG